jgi:hypothetical protein
VNVSNAPAASLIIFEFVLIEEDGWPCWGSTNPEIDEESDERLNPFPSII